MKARVPRDRGKVRLQDSVPSIALDGTRSECIGSFLVTFDGLKISICLLQKSKAESKYDTRL